jgi:RNA polymerase sigma-70 factor (ECF subfamily)
MHSDAHELKLVEKAVEGDHVALEKLLVSQAEVLSRYAASKLPAWLREQIDPEDITQQTFAEAFRSIRRFCPEQSHSFQAWLLGIADHVLKDTVKRHQRAKRGGRFQRVQRAEPTPSRSAVDFVEILSAGIHSPSYSVMGHEAVQAVQEAMAALPDDYRQAVQLRLIEGKSLEETAEMMNRSARAVQGLVDRAKKKMRAALGRLSNYR